MQRINTLLSLLLLGSVVAFEGCQPAADNLLPDSEKTNANSRVVVRSEPYDVNLEGVPCYDGSCGGNESLQAQAMVTSPYTYIYGFEPDGGPSEWYYSITSNTSTDPYYQTTQNSKASKPASKTITTGIGNVIVQLSTTAEVMANSECPTFSNVLRAYIIVEDQGSLYKQRIYGSITEGPYYIATFSNGSSSGTGGASGSDGKGTRCDATGHFIKFENLPANIVGFTYVLDKRYYADYDNLIWIKTGRQGTSGKDDKCYEDGFSGGPDCAYF
ncbi:hypothetical protein GCM10023189_60710 [Nibrella saemangeumensis]|uniref:Lipoprotein n=1 Tax=Nibrella saemangeumensis TaxID=1084526 RepID=A0ABP8NU31_9BACT